MTSMQIRMITFQHSLCPRRITGGLVLLAVVAFSSELLAQSQVSEVPPPIQTDYVGTGAPDEWDSGLKRFNSSEFESGNIAWMMASGISCLFLLTPGLLLFYCGLLKTHGVATVMIRYLGVVAVLSMAWVLWIYCLGFARNSTSSDVLESERVTATGEKNPLNRIFGSSSHLGFGGLDSQLKNDGPTYALRRPDETIPHLLFMTCQLMFFTSVPVPLLVSLHGRMTWAALAAGAVLWGTFVYAPTVYLVWGSGSQGTVLDSAGALPAHVSLGFSALVAAMFMSRAPRCEDGTESSRRTVLLGLGIAFFWSGSLVWNASRSMTVDGYAMNAFVVTHFAACGGLIGWCGADWMIRGKLGLVSLCIGPFVGLVSIASGSSYVAPQSAIMIGLLSSAVACLAYTSVRKRFPGNSMAIVFVLHAVGGVMGIMLTGVFATASVAGLDRSGNPIGGLVEGNLSRPLNQAFAASFAAGLALLGTLAIVLIFRFIDSVRRKVAASSADVAVAP